MIIGSHIVVYSTNPDADRAFFRDVLGFPSVDAGRGWLLFALPPSEGAFHPADQNGQSELYFMCDNVRADTAALTAKGVICDPLVETNWGITTRVQLPSGTQIGLYQPKHPTTLGLRRDA